MTKEIGARRQEWVVIASCFMLTLATGPLFFTLTTFFTSFEADFGWSRALISSVQSTTLVIAASSNFSIGWLTDRFGPRRPLIICSVLMGIGLILCSQTHYLWQLILLYAIASLGSGANYVIPMSTVQRFVSERRAGLALGLTSSGIALSRFIFVPIAGFLISAMGWQSTYIILGIVVWVLMVIPAMLIPSQSSTKSPVHGGSPAPGEPGTTIDIGGSAQEIVSPARMSLGEVLRTRIFLFACIMFVLPIMSNHMIAVHIVPFAEGTGIPKTAAATAAGLIGAFGIGGTILWPSLSNRIPWRWLVFISGAVSSLAVLWLIVTDSLWMLYLFVIVYGFFYHASSPTRIGLIRHLFGTRVLASIIGIVTGLGTLFGALGPVLGGYIYDHTGSYGIAFTIGAICWATSALVAIMLKRSGEPQHNGVE
ncbi:MFS transporter [Chloroflexota bacterium]